jgi:hypothetical protein
VVSEEVVLLCSPSSGPEDVDHPDDVLPADGTLAHALAAPAAGDHVSALQQHTVHGVVHADPAQFLVRLGGCG